jgi:hypothetical protein
MKITTKICACRKYLKVGSLVTVEMDTDQIKGYIGEINEGGFYIWQNEKNGATGKLNPEIESKGKYKYSWLFLFEDDLNITIINKPQNEPINPTQKPFIQPITLLISPSIKPLTRFKFKHTIMNNIVNFAKNLTLSKEEKLLRKSGLKDECGNYTREARRIVMIKLCSENETHLVEIATELDKEIKGNK